jgi:deazaflavin-dependent oxidoreductase (nitroreductase family)
MESDTMSNSNQPIIDEFRSNQGRVGGYFANKDLVLLTTTGAKSGKPRTAPLAYFKDGDRLLVTGTKGGAPTNPDWYYNLLANPNVSVEVGTETFTARAVPLPEPERSAAWRTIVARAPSFGDYEHKTNRVIPVVALERIGPNGRHNVEG